MVLFHSMTTISLYTAGLVALLLWFGTGRQPLAVAGVFMRTLFSSWPRFLFFISLLAILLLNKFELKLEALFPVTYDLTSALTGWEGSWQAALQSAVAADGLTAFCSVFYLVVFQAVMIASIAIYTYQGNLKLYYAFCVSLLLNYFIALPFFLFVPVDEAWSVSPGIRFLMLDVFPRFETEYRRLSGLDNCVPSLHTSISVTMALLAARSGNRRWAVFAGFSAAVILFSIFYLGIHWFTDMALGLCLAAVSVFIGIKVGERADRVSGVKADSSKSKVQSRPVHTASRSTSS
ncbi:phosphatase PAP2 family protein [Cohnella thailandensis]|uniref:Inositol phosphorylceramide synthase n=1 Tax=Cohnella thailandensis TaxID=557557 RepID=A0A841SVQ6_9BACL|nr:phosphatase PAP2 family protein [Cohnella thailandensis]MBB6633950.1 inositol phosphorylceramide synthase [Cohnella thailandensis]MBP1972633.1 membrane-associated phospholipid phosphatase [Cohnella thailandensis]